MILLLRLGWNLIIVLLISVANFIDFITFVIFIVLGRLICDFQFVTLSWSYFMWNCGNFGHFGSPEFCFLETIPHSKLLKFPKVSLCDTQILSKIKLYNLRRSKIVNLFILIFEKIPQMKVLEITKIPKFWQSENCKLACPGLYWINCCYLP